MEKESFLLPNKEQERQQQKIPKKKKNGSFLSPIFILPRIFIMFVPVYSYLYLSRNISLERRNLLHPYALFGWGQ